LPTGQSDGVWPDTLAYWLEGRTDYAPEGAESFDDLQARILPVWRRLTEESQGKTLVIVAHGVVCKVVLLSILPGWSLADWTKLRPFHNVCLSELVDEDGQWRAVRLAEDVVDVQ
jgi:broad specificity phosphatase PhoE